MHFKNERIKVNAAVCENPKKFVIKEKIIDYPVGDELLVRIEGCGVCGSNLPLWEGRSWFQYPMQPGSPGHEAWGRVELTGEKVTKVKMNDRVCILNDSAFAEYAKVQQDFAVKIPSELDDIPFPGEALACAMNIFKRIKCKSNETVLLIGGGFMGNLLAQLLLKEVKRVILVSKRKYSLELAQKVGVSSVILFTNTEDILSEIEKITSGAMCDCVIEVTGYQESLDIASKAVKEHGRIVIAGYHQDGIRTINMQEWNWKGLDIINAHERDPYQYLQGMSDAMYAMLNKTIDTSCLYTHTVELKEINDAFTLLHERPNGFMKALVHI
jgi:threonine dehydrogenase-like Zn-dependent dehydrogenase